MPPLAINGIDSRSEGLRLAGIPTFANLPQRKVVLLDAAGSYGAHLVRIDGGGARQLPISFTLVKNTLANRRTAMDRVNALFSGGLDRVVLDVEGTPRVVDGVLDGEPTWELQRAFRVPVAVLRVVLSCPNPVWRSLYGTAIGFTGADATLPIGTGPSPVVFRVMGAATTPRLYVLDAWGNTRVDIELPTLLSTEYLEIDSGRGTISKFTSGSRSSVIGLCNIHSAFPFSLDKSWGDALSSAHPRFRVAGASNADALYTAAWL